MELPAKYVVPLKRYGDRALCFPQNQTEMRGLAFRRFKRYCKIKNRIKKQYKFYENLFVDFYNSVLDGKSHQYLKHTSRICSCYICKNKDIPKKIENLILIINKL